MRFLNVISFVCVAVTLHSSNGAPSNAFNQQISFQCYNQGNLKFVVVPYDNAANNLQPQCISKSSNTVLFYFPGLSKRPSQNEPSIDIVVTELIKKGGILPIVVNYENLLPASPTPPSANIATVIVTMLTNYAGTMQNASLIATNVADVFAQMITSNSITVANVRFLGQSIGAQIVSQMVRQIRNQTGTTFPRITALDPAGPGYYFPSQQLSKSDATFVDVFHTNPGIYGYAFDCGTVDFYFNYPFIFQPGCNDLAGFINGDTNSTFCSHEKVWAFYAESINTPQNFPACNNIWAFPLGFCKIDSSTAYAGYDVSTQVSGRYALHVKSSSPYGMGTGGP